MATRENEIKILEKLAAIEQITKNTDDNVKRLNGNYTTLAKDFHNHIEDDLKSFALINSRMSFYAGCIVVVVALGSLVAPVIYKYIGVSP